MSEPVKPNITLEQASSYSSLIIERCDESIGYLNSILEILLQKQKNNFYDVEEWKGESYEGYILSHKHTESKHKSNIQSEISKLEEIKENSNRCYREYETQWRNYERELDLYILYISKKQNREKKR